MPDPAGPSGKANWRVILERTLPHVDLFLPSVEELEFMLQRERFDQLAARAGAGSPLVTRTPENIVSLADEALNMGAGAVVLKMGTGGLYLRTAKDVSGWGRGRPSDRAAWSDRQLWVPCFRPRTVTSTVGTGDAAIAGFLAALLRNCLPELALSASAAAGAYCAEVAGAQGGMPTWDELLTRIRTGWDQLSLHLGADGWRWDREGCVWRGPGER
jgi:sugar/nucleoside kinase (ribokinase family)